jgi:phage/plasmid primase-like uncharacterized protein
LYVVYPDPVVPTWAFGDWSLGGKERGESDPAYQLTPEEAAARKRRLRELQEKVAAEEARAHVEAAVEAQQRWDQAGPAPKDHGYLRSKQIDLCGARMEGGSLVVPMHDITGKLWSLQEISPDGYKHNQPGGRRKGCFFQIGEIGDTFCIGEGFSTCASIRMATGYAVVSAGEAGNLEAVARALREKYPAATMVMCGDDDWLTKVNGKPTNVGRLAAEKAAKAVGGVLALPWFGSARPQWATDFNDQARLSGIEDVKTTIKLALIRYEEDQRHEREAEPPPAMPEDFLLEPVKRAVGPWNFCEVSPQHLLGNFNGFLKSVILRVSEARDLGDVDKFKFYDHSKSFTAAPPDVLRVNEKHLREHSVLNVTGVIITSNYKTDGIFLPRDDRRHFVAWSELNRDDFAEGYWRSLWRWYENGGYGHVAAYLATLEPSHRSTQRHRRRRLMHFGQSWTQAAPLRTLNLRMFWTSSETQTP